MAIITKLELHDKNPGKQKLTEATYCIFIDSHGEKHLQIDTTGSNDRQITGKVSQSLRFSPEIIKQLKEILATNF